MEQKYLKGLFFKKPHHKAPEFVLAKCTIKREDLIKTLQELKDEYINLDIKKATDGEVYGQIDTWKPSVGKVVENPENIDF